MAQGWLTGDAASVDLARQLGLVMMLQGAVISLLGPMIARALLFPLVYTFFLVPFGESMEGPLQTVTVAMVMPLLHAVGVPAQVDGVLITIPNGYFEVAEACSGAKFEIAMIAYGTLVANVCYVSWRRRAAFMAMALVVPIIANGLRAFGTIYAAHLTSVAQATGYDHIVYGWIFFGLVMAAVLAIGWRWFDRDPLAPWFDVEALQRQPGHRIDVTIAAALVLTVAALFPAWSAAIAGRAEALPQEITLPRRHRLGPRTAQCSCAVGTLLSRRGPFPVRPLCRCTRRRGRSVAGGLWQPARRQGTGEFRHRRSASERRLGTSRRPARYRWW